MVKVADSSCLWGRIEVGKGAYFAQGTVIRSLDNAVKVGNDSWVLENSVVIGTKDHPAQIGAKTVLGHKTVVVGATIGNLCEIGNNCLIMQGAKIGEMCILGEGTLIGAEMIIPDYSVVLGRPGRVIRGLTGEDRAMIFRMRGNDLTLSPYEGRKIERLLKEGKGMGKLYPYQDKYPQISESTILFESAEVTGDVTIGEKTIIGSGVKIIGDSHGPVRIGNNVQILENSVLHLLPDNELIIEDNVIIGPGCMIHGCRIGSGSVIEPGAIVCDNSSLGKNTLVKAGSLVKQRSQFGSNCILEGFPAEVVGNIAEVQIKPSWGFVYEQVLDLSAGQRR